MDEAARDICSFFKGIGVKYAFTGGYAAKMHGVEKPLHDLDLFIASDDMDAALKALDEPNSGYRLIEIPGGSQYKYESTKHHIQFDLFRSPYLEKELESRIEFKNNLPVVNLNTFLETKLRGLQLKDSQKNKDEIKKLLEINRLNRDKIINDLPEECKRIFKEINV